MEACGMLLRLTAAERSQWFQITATLLNTAIPGEKQLPALENQSPLDDKVIPHARKLIALSKTVEVITSVLSLQEDDQEIKKTFRPCGGLPGA
ncbi:hypothetical protein N7451_000398 [Penicillium sp. IBT 35674x]|nr:hypothetical protein N7451_000398 [Penicillium sp. IBT 35674x]